MFKKLLNNIYNKIKESSKGIAAVRIIAILPLIISILVLMVWFFCACYGWLVLVFPTFKLFPMWAFVLLMFIMSIGNQFWKLFFSDRYE